MNKIRRENIFRRENYFIEARKIESVFFQPFTGDKKRDAISRDRYFRADNEASWLAFEGGLITNRFWNDAQNGKRTPRCVGS